MRWILSVPFFLLAGLLGGVLWLAERFVLFVCDTGLQILGDTPLSPTQNKGVHVLKYGLAVIRGQCLVCLQTQPSLSFLIDNFTEEQVDQINKILTADQALALITLAELRQKQIERGKP